MSEIRTTEREERLEEAMERIAQWADAYPTSVFPVPDDDYMQRAHEVLKAHGMTVDRISADAMRHVLRGIGRIARAAFDEGQAAMNETTEGPVKVIRRPLRSKRRVIECTKEESERMLNALGKALASPIRDDGSSKKEFRRG